MIYLVAASGKMFFIISLNLLFLKHAAIFAHSIKMEVLRQISLLLVQNIVFFPFRFEKSHNSLYVD